MQKIPALFKSRRGKIQKSIEGNSDKLSRQKSTICALCLPKKNLDMLYNSINHDTSGQDKHTTNTF